MQDMMKKPSGSRSFSTSTRHLEDLQKKNTKPDDASASLVADMVANVDFQAAELAGLKFSPPKPLAKTDNFRSRYEPLLEQFTKLLMEDGKLSLAQKVYTQSVLSVCAGG